MAIFVSLPIMYEKTVFQSKLIIIVNAVRGIKSNSLDIIVKINH